MVKVCLRNGKMSGIAGELRETDSDNFGSCPQRVLKARTHSLDFTER